MRPTAPASDLRTSDSVWTLTAEVFGQAGAVEIHSVVQPRFQAGLRFRPIDRFNIDLIYGRNIQGENANWVTLATVIRFPPSEK
jgi:coproporphyrinogen III oxidase-like Fe-S oxidoreductase